ncbi:MAG TPA: adenine phosphoribosyltransferase [Verrucomicrobiae bacterium]|nr:adenine phosphoribosyltransferase [Verrucomicrobiae bacterium]
MDRPSVDLSVLKETIRDVPDFPQKGIVFKDITPLLQRPDTFAFVIDSLAGALLGLDIDVIMGIESRGFILSPALSYKINAGFVPVRKKGKLPWRTHQMSYTLEYGEGILEMHQDAIKPGMRVALVDDLLATGGTGEAAAKLAEKMGARIEKILFLVELGFLKGRERLSRYDVFSLIQY